MSTPDAQGFVTAVRAVTAAQAGPRAEDDALAVARMLLARWQEPGRGYHTARHLAEVLDRLEELAAAGVAAAHEPTVTLAAWFHDAIYLGRPGEDEEASAVLARTTLEDLGVEPPAVAEVCRLVLLTRDHWPAEHDLAGQSLCDADLAILAAPAERYAQYVRDVRREYQHLPVLVFRAGRRRLVRGLLERARSGNLFQTAPAQGWAADAERNLAAELAAPAG